MQFCFYIITPVGGASGSNEALHLEEEARCFPSRSKMAPTRRLKRVAASQPGFISFKSSSNHADLVSGKRKRVSKNKKKNWNKHSDINDVEEFLEDIRHQERTTG